MWNLLRIRFSAGFAVNNIERLKDDTTKTEVLEKTYCIWYETK
jgi:hypothetical protein